MGIVKEIQEAIRPIIESVTGHSRLNYEYDIERNANDGMTAGYGFIPSVADFVDGQSLGFTTKDHTFQCVLTDDYSNSDCDEGQNDTVLELYEKEQNLLKELQKSRLVLPTPTNQVLLIRGLSIEEPEFLGENSTVALRVNFNIRYKYRNN